MKKIILTVLLAVSCAFSSLTALSWSGVIDNTSKLSLNDSFKPTVFNQTNGIYLSLSSKLNEEGNLRFVAEGLFKVNPIVDINNSKTTVKFIADVDLLKFSGDWAVGPGYLSLSAGRFQFSDFSGVVFSQVSDGLYLNYKTAKIKTSLYAGYTGLLNALNVSMTGNQIGPNDNFYALCPKYVPVLADFSYKGLFGSSTIGLQAAGFIPVSDENTMNAYGTFILNGQFGNIGSYDARFTLGTIKFEDFMLNAKLDANFFVSSTAMVTAGVEYASGAQGGIVPFQTISARSFGSGLYSPMGNGVIIPKLGVMYSNGKVYASLTERGIIAMSEDESKFDGLDTAAAITYKLLSDVLIGCDIGAYICFNPKENSKYYATVKASLAF